MTEQPVNPLFEADSGGSGESIDLRAYLNIVLKHKFVILLALVAFVTGTVLYTMRQPRIYETHASVVIDPRPADILGAQVQEIVQLGTGTYWANQEYYKTQMDLLKSRRLAEMTVRKFDLHDNAALVKATDASEDKRIEIAVSALLGAMRLRRPEENRIVNIYIRHTDPKLAAYLANAHVDTYVQYTLDLRIEGTDYASKWLTNELDAAEKELLDSENALVDFKESNDILSVSMEDRQNLVATAIQRYTEALNNSRAERIEIGAMRNRVRSVMNDDVFESPIFSLGDSEAGEVLKQQYYAESHRLEELQQELGGKHPELVSQRSKVEAIKAAMLKEAKVIERAIEEKYQAALATEKEFAKQVEYFKQQAHALGPKVVEYNRLARNERSKEEKYSIVMGRLRTSDLTSRLKTVNIHPLDAARVPAGPISPNMSRNVAMAVVFGLLLGFVLSFFIEFLDRTIKTSDDVERAIAAPVLGIIPAIIEDVSNTGRSEQRDLHVFREPTSRAAECMRSIRTNLMFMAADRDFKTMLVTSPNPKEGKTTTVLYMATTMAQSGQRVLVVDSDLRRPRVHQSMGVSRTQGLSNLILGEVEPEDVVKSTEVHNLYVLPCGPTPPNPAELLMTDKFRNVLDDLSSRYDRVLFDSPPLLAVTDAVVLSRLTDGIVMVVRAGTTQRDEAFRAAKQLRDVNSKITGVILNRLDVSDRTYGYYQHYYAYGYGADGAESEKLPA